MKKEILNLADDCGLIDGSAKRDAFILEFQSAVVLMREDDFDQFYAFADIIMQKELSRAEVNVSEIMEHIVAVMDDFVSVDDEEVSASEFTPSED
jgi:hypothetical protein